MNASYSNKSSSVWGPPYSGGLGQTAPVAPLPVGGTACHRYRYKTWTLDWTMDWIMYLVLDWITEPTKPLDIALGEK